MPLYDISCRACGEKSEVLTKSLEALSKAKNCPKCNSKAIDILPPKSSFILSGSGWAKDGYSKKS